MVYKITIKFGIMVYKIMVYKIITKVIKSFLLDSLNNVDSWGLRVEVGSLDWKVL